MATSTIDLKAQATFPIRLGTSTRITSIRYNHKPQFKQSESLTARIQGDHEPGKSRLSVDAQDGEYTYSGTCRQKEASFVLVVQGQGKDRELVLERLSNSHTYNLTLSPTQNDASRLSNQYPQLQDDSEDDLFGNDDEGLPPDDLNPFDYRHLLKGELERSENASTNLDATRSTAGTPAVPPRPVASSAPVVKLPKRTETKAQPLKKRKPAPVEKANPKRVKAGQEPPPAAEASKAKARPEVPKISLDRKASLRRPSVDDGELILENETPVTEKAPRHSAMALALNGQLGSTSLRAGPISLQSAANSPGSHMASPGPSRPQDAEEEYVFEFDEDPETEDDQVPDELEIEEDEDADADADVDNFELPSPAQQRHSVAAVPADDDDDLDQQLAAAMMEDDSEESEEE